ncbi:MAG: hypothetical protein ACJ8G3_27280, partial [Burkholderiaceae bacterium]
IAMCAGGRNGECRTSALRQGKPAGDPSGILAATAAGMPEQASVHVGFRTLAFGESSADV